jgi:serine protease Do
MSLGTAWSEGMRTARQLNSMLLVLIALNLALIPSGPARAETTLEPIAAVVNRVQSAVVRITTIRAQREEDEAKGSQTQSQTVSGDTEWYTYGSGFVIDPSGYIATNKHVVEGAASIFVSTMDGARRMATVVGTPSQSDMALLKIDADHPLPVVTFGNSDNMHVGDTVIAIGSPFGFDGSVTSGIISAVNRDIMESPFDDYIQTDAPINHGNSGGPLFNLAGEVIGMNSVIIAPGKVGGSIGLGFAIPAKDLRFVFDRLIATGQVRAGMLPIRTQQVTWMIAQAIGLSGQNGALVDSLKPGGDEMMAGQIKPGDVILSFNGQEVLDPRDLAREAARAAIGSDAVLEISRGGVQREVRVPIQAWPEGKPIVTSSREPQPLGLELASAQSDDGAAKVVIASLDPGGTAACSGLEKGDVILQVQQEPISTPDQALRILHVQTFKQRPFAIVLIQRGTERHWVPISIPD